MLKARGAIQGSGRGTPHNKEMGLLYVLADAFINAFGITKPTEKARRQAAVFIGVLLFLIVAGMVGAVVVIHAVTR